MWKELLVNQVKSGENLKHLEEAYNRQIELRSLFKGVEIKDLPYKEIQTPFGKVSNKFSIEYDYWVDGNFDEKVLSKYSGVPGGLANLLVPKHLIKWYGKVLAREVLKSL